MNLIDPDFKKAKQIALRRLNRRECSSGEISKLLKENHFSTEIILELVQELIEKKYLNDERYTRMLVREQILRGKGPMWIQMKLKEKGIEINRSEIQTLIEEAGETSELEMAKAILLRKYPKAAEDPQVARKALQALMRRGFSYAIAKAALSKFLLDPEEQY